jgi:hypothetical protein
MSKHSISWQRPRVAAEERHFATNGEPFTVSSPRAPAPNSPMGAIYGLRDRPQTVIVQLRRCPRRAAAPI